MTHIEDILLIALTQKGKPYLFGAEARASDPQPNAFDCSELVQWSCDRAGLVPAMPDGAYNQREHCRRAGLSIPVGQGMRTRGALLFVGDGTGTGRGAITHVAWSLGDSTTIEARGRAWGVATWPSTNRFDFAALVPGADYTPGYVRLTPGDDMDSGQNDALIEIRDNVRTLRADVDDLQTRVKEIQDTQAREIAKG